MIYRVRRFEGIKWHSLLELDDKVDENILPELLNIIRNGRRLSQRIASFSIKINRKPDEIKTVILRIKPLVEQIASDFVSLARKGFNPESKLDWIYFWKIEDDFRAIFRDLQEIEQRTRFLSSDFSLPICEAYLNKIESFIRLIYSALYNVLGKEIKKDMFAHELWLELRNRSGIFVKEEKKSDTLQSHRALEMEIIKGLDDKKIEKLFSKMKATRNLNVNVDELINEIKGEK